MICLNQRSTNEKRRGDTGLLVTVSLAAPGFRSAVGGYEPTLRTTARQLFRATPNCVSTAT